MKTYVSTCITVALLLFSLTPLFAGTLDCSGCHAKTGSGDIRPLDSAYRNITTGGFQGNHQTHMSSGATAATCSVCHSNTDYQADHRDGKIQADQKIGNYSGVFGRARYNTTRDKKTVAGLVFFNQTSVPVLATCSNANCHFEAQTLPWGTEAVTAKMGCTSCHASPPLGTSGTKYVGGAGGSHEVHTQSTYFKYSCSRCHPDHTAEPVPFSHATSIGKRDIAVTPVDLLNKSGRFISGGDRNYLPGQAATHTYGTCTNVYCHSSVQADGGTGTPTYSSPRWGSSVRWGGSVVGCGDATGCHPVIVGHHHNPPASVATIGTGSHTKHLKSFNASINSTQVGTVCFTCHNWGYPTPVPNITGCYGCHFSGNQPALHVDGKIRIAFNSTFTFGLYSGQAMVDKVPQTGYRSCGNTYCHSDGTFVVTGNLPANDSPRWGSGTMTCSGCHGYPPSYPNGRPKANTHNSHTTYGDMTCNTCHYDVTKDNINITDTSKHVNKIYNVSIDFVPGWITLTYSPPVSTTAGGTCITTCHNGESSVQWGGSACLSCHNMGADGSRLQIDPASHPDPPEPTSNATCVKCHKESLSDGTIDHSFHQNGVIDKK